MEEKTIRLMPGITLFIISLFLLPQISGATDLNLSWDPSKDSEVVGYKIHYGTSSRNYSHTVDVGNTTKFRLENLSDGVTYYVAVTAYDRAGNESGFSEEVFGVPGRTVSTNVVSPASPGGATILGTDPGSGYRDFLEFRDFRITERRLRGSIKNTGNRTVEYLVIETKCLDSQGKVVYRKQYQIVPYGKAEKSMKPRTILGLFPENQDVPPSAATVEVSIHELRLVQQ